MSNPDIKQAASLITSENIKFTDAETIAVTAQAVLPRLSEEVDLDVDSTSKSRKEQSFLRAFHANGRLSSQCVLCGEEYPLEFLVAAHIKKRSECSNSEKLDFENVAALMCKAGCDDLFEKGYVFVSDGEIYKSSKRNTTSALDSLINKLVGNKVSNWHGSKEYYKHHKTKFNK
eukprot:GHVR01046468.1.p1 GENE.GHVR01046468.1~~GHVR01046468.1.p1  ORF type:complete len:174 (-),score=7.07 GHVR01046468.1:606-1127(-)